MNHIPRPRTGLRQNQLTPGTFVWWTGYHGSGTTGHPAVITEVNGNQISVKSLATFITITVNYSVSEDEDSIFTDMEICSTQRARDYLAKRLIESKKKLDIQVATHHRLELEIADLIEIYLPDDESTDH